MRAHRLIGGLCCGLMLGCAASPGTGASREPPSDAGSPEAIDAADRIEEHGLAPAFCVRGARDAVATLFCGNDATQITSFARLRERLGLTAAVMLGYTTGLGSRFVSPINPRIIIRRGGSLSARNAEFAVAAFTRGRQLVELAALDAEARRFTFYLLEFSQACNAADGGCRPGDLFTPDIEADWLAVRVRDDEALKNTPEDCRRCHGGGPNRAGPMLLMRELAAPWTHWIQEPSPLRDDYLAAKRDPRQPGGNASEPYAGIMLTAVVSAGSLEELITSAERTGLQPTQPLLFPSAEIGFETGERIFDGGPYRRPANQTDDFARSPIWQALYDAFRAGDAAAPPYQHERVADDAKLRALATQYQAYLAGTLSKGDLPDLSNVLPDDPQRLAEAGFGVEPDASGPSLLLQACAECHNQTLDPSISRARFDVDLNRTGRAGIESALLRLELPADDPRRMPPAGFRSLTSEDRRRLAQYLQSVAP